MTRKSFAGPPTLAYGRPFLATAGFFLFLCYEHLSDRQIDGRTGKKLIMRLIKTAA